MATMVSRLLDAADALVERGPKSSAFRRRAVSTAYYAVFHALAKGCAGFVLPSERPSSDMYEQVYRALDHKPLKTAFGRDPLRSNDRLRSIGDLVIKLQSERHRADYLPPTNDVFSLNQAKDLVEQARRAVADIEALNDSDLGVLAVALLFKVRER